MRAETVIAGHRVVTIVRGETYYAYDRTLRKGVAIRRSGRAVAFAARGARLTRRDEEAHTGSIRTRSKPPGGRPRGPGALVITDTVR